MRSSGDLVTIAVPEGVDWWFHRIASSEHYASSLFEIRTQWALVDVQSAHEVCDMYDALQARAAERD